MKLHSTPAHTNLQCRMPARAHTHTPRRAPWPPSHARPSPTCSKKENSENRVSVCARLYGELTLPLDRGAWMTVTRERGKVRHRARPTTQRIVAHAPHSSSNVVRQILEVTR